MAPIHINLDDPQVEICVEPKWEHALLISRETGIEFSVVFKLLRSMRASSLVAIAWSPDDDLNLEAAGFVHLDGLKVYMKQL